MKNIFRGKDILLKIGLYLPVVLFVLYAGVPTMLDFARDYETRKIQEKNHLKVIKTVELLKIKVELESDSEAELNVYYIEQNVSKSAKMNISRASFDFILSMPISINPELMSSQLVCNFKQQEMTDIISISCPTYEKSNQIIEYSAGE